MPAKPAAASKSKAAVVTKGADVPEKTYQGLRRFNLVMGFLHLMQGILMIVLSNDTTYPIYTNFLKFDLAARSPGARSEAGLRAAASARRLPCSC